MQARGKSNLRNECKKKGDVVCKEKKGVFRILGVCCESWKSKWRCER